MIHSHIEKVLEHKLGHQPTEDQLVAIRGLAFFIAANTNDSIFLLTGYAGTGKTSLISAMVHTLESFNIQSVLLAPTGRAAKVLASYTGMASFTIHKHIYRQKSSKDGMGRFELDRNMHRDAYFIVDEASMISQETSEPSVFGSGRLLDDLVEYVYRGRNCKLVLVGDTAQLPPVGSVLSPALSVQYLSMYGFNIETAELRDVVRQSRESGILMNATSIRKKVAGNDLSVPEFMLEGYNDILRISGETLLEELEESYSRAGIDGTVIIVNSNRMANKYNQGIRNRILFREEEISSGDMLMIVKNNYFWAGEEENLDFIANGDIARIRKVLRKEERYGFRFADMVLDFIDYSIELEVKVLLDTLSSESAAFSGEQNKILFEGVMEDYSHLSTKKKRYDAVREDAFFNAMQVKFAYAVTCHKAQGGQWERVFIDQGMFNRKEPAMDYLRWLYTAVTRATERLYLVNFLPAYFGGD
ncbi:MAG TPA: ATP-dependent endonuclease [Bacteroidetes bacterium]|nr:ATP-dependent endonuclease [Bacteroidota bacterium]